MNEAAEFVSDDIQLLHEAADGLGAINFMEVCGTHTMSAFRCGLPSLLPPQVTLLSGPGCPVCVTAQGDVDQMVNLAYLPNVTVCTYGDMLRVPGRRGSLQSARAQGADVRVVYSATDAIQHARREPDRQVVFAAVGFETTAPATAVVVKMAARQRLSNFSVLVSHKRVLPAIRALLDRDQTHLDGLLCPGHVSVILGADAYRPLVDHYNLPCVIAGFEEKLMISALTQLIRQVRTGVGAVENQYPEAVTHDGNRVALRLIEDVFQPVAAHWRGLGEIVDSGFGLREEYGDFDAAKRFDLKPIEGSEHPKCLCGKVITATAVPPDCELFASSCTPTRPLGPCMVSSEGACQAWFKYRRQPCLGSNSKAMSH